jgi:hypothetical protein
MTARWRPARSSAKGATLLAAIAVFGADVAHGVCELVERPAMRINAWAVKEELLVGEPLILSATVTTSGRVRLDKDLSWSQSPLRVLIDRGRGFTRYLEKVWVSDWYDAGDGILPGGTATMEYVLSYDSYLNDWVFPKAGIYRVVLEYDGARPQRSNVITVTVREPTGVERAVHGRLRQMGPEVLGLHIPNVMPRGLGALLREYPASVYLQEQRLNDLDARLALVQVGKDPHRVGGEPAPFERVDLRGQTMKERLESLLPMAIDAAEVPGQFQAEALGRLADIYKSVGDEEAALSTRDRIVREFPNRSVARRMRTVVRE